MNLNCRPGDLAVFVRSMAGNEGRIVRCLRLLTSTEKNARELDGGRVWWETDSIHRFSHGKPDSGVPDSFLRPIRDPGEDAVDEMVLRCPVPSTKRTPQTA